MPDLFDVIDDILYKKHGGQLNCGDINMWVVLRMISFHPDPRAKECAITFEKFKNSLSNQALYMALYQACPKCKWDKIKYIKSKKESTVDESTAAVHVNGKSLDF